MSEAQSGIFSASDPDYARSSGQQEQQREKDNEHGFQPGHPKALHCGDSPPRCSPRRPSRATRPNPLGSARQTKTDVAGLNAPAQILVDVWGIPHIYAGNEHDLFFLQGFNAARDRLWQIDLWRKRGLGLLAKDFGAAYAEQDKALRLFLYRGDMNAEWAAYGPKAKTYADAFVAGVNAYVADVRRASARARSSSGSPAPCRICGRRTTSSASAATA